MRPPRYAARLDAGIVRLEDAAARTTVGIRPSRGNAALEMRVNGQDVLAPGGIPFMAPWANRLDEPAFYANGRRYPFDLQLGNIRGGDIPIHGFLTGSDSSPVVWNVIEARADESAAWVTSRLDVSGNPAWMKQWPFAHTLEMTWRLLDGVLEARTTVINHSIEPMPVAIGFHPYFQLTDSPRRDWTLSIGARTHYLLAPTKIPTGETEPIERQFPDPARVPLGDCDLDDVYADLIRDDAGRAVVTVKGAKTQQLDIVLGSRWKALVIWNPPGRSFVCIEPMAGPTNAINMAHKGRYRELQHVPPNGGVWEESFWVRPLGF